MLLLKIYNYLLITFFKICISLIQPVHLPSFKKKIMANHKATKKDVRQAAKRRERNRYYGKTTRNAIRDIKEVKETGAFTEKLPLVASMIDKLAKRGIIHKNKAANLKRKLARKVPAAATA
ncbi:MAG: 30S ribosomal protein S20 [Segetibacter sp.]